MARPARSRPENVTKCLIFLLLNILETPKTKGKHLVMSPALEQALSTIQKGAEERLEVLKPKKSQLEAGESSDATVPKIIGHIEKVEPAEDEDEAIGDKGQETVAGGS